MINFMKFYLLFWIFSVFGWIMEEIVCSISEKKIVNRGFLIGPYCPIYGFGGLIMIFLIPYKNEPLICFILAAVLCSVLEYITSYIMEKIYKVRFWDYSNDSFNINGRICLRNSIAFGLLGLISVSYIIPFFLNLLSKYTPFQLYLLFIIVFIMTLIDIIISCNIMNNIKRTIDVNLEKFKNNDATNEIKKLVSKNLRDSKIFEKRIIKSFKNIQKELDEVFDTIDDKIDEFKKKVSNIKVTYYTALGLLLGIILGYLVNNYILFLTIGIIIGFIIDIVIYRLKEKKNGK